MALGLEIQDDHRDFEERHQHSFGVAPGDHTLELDFSKAGSGGAKRTGPTAAA